MRIQTAIVLLLLAFSVIPLATQGILGQRLVSESLEERAIDQLESISDLQESRLRRVLSGQAERFDLIAGRNALQESLAAIANGQGGGHASRVHATITAINGSSTDIRALHVFAADGAFVASTAGQPSDRILEWRNASVDGLRLDLFALDPQGRIINGVSGPIIANGTRLGTLVIEADASPIIELTQDFEGLGETGETTMVFRDADGNARFVAPTRFDPDAAFQRVAFVEDSDSPSLIGLRTRSDLTVEAVDYRGERVFASVRYIETLDWALATKIDRAEALAPADELRNTLVLLSAATAFAAIVMGTAVGYRLLARPVQESASYADRVRRGARADLPTARPGGIRLDEVEALDTSVHAMAEGLQATARYRASLLNATSHALRTPLTPLKLNVYQLERRIGDGDPDTAALVTKIKANLDRLEGNVNAFVEASRIETETGPLQLVDDDLARITHAAVAMQQDQAEQKAVTLDTTGVSNVPASVDAHLVQMAIALTIDVALQNTGPGDYVNVATRVVDGDAHIVVEDTGPALADGTEADAFDAFPTLAEQDKVLGRATEGLATVRRLIEMHRGEVWIENRTDTTGTRVTIALPRAAAGRARRHRAWAKASPDS